MIRSRADTAALTMNPTTANSAAATNPIPRAPMIPSATGSVDEGPGPIHLAHDDPAADRRRPKPPRRPTRRLRARPTATIRQVARPTSLPSNRSSATVARSTIAVGSAGSVAGNAVIAPVDDDVAADAVEQDRQLVADRAGRRRRGRARSRRWGSARRR